MSELTIARPAAEPAEDAPPAPRRRRLPSGPAAWGALVVFAATASAMIWTYASTHQIFPDTQWYLIYTLRMLGEDRAGSERIVLDYIRDHGTFPPYDYLWASKPYTLSYRPRMLLPVLSVPFVGLFGPGGIVVVPGIAFVAAMLAIYRFVTRFASVPAATAASVLAVASPLVAKWCVGGLTDSMALLLHTSMLLLLPWHRAATRWTVLGLAVVTFLTATTRVITPFTVGTVAAVWCWAMWRERDRWRTWTVAAAGAAAGVVAGAVWTKVVSAPYSSATHFVSMTGGEARSLGEAMPWYRENLPPALAKELTTIFSSWPLVLLIVLSFVACFVAWRTVVPWLVVSAWVGAAGIFLTAPFATLFRYELPVLPALALAVAVLVDRVYTGLRGAPTPAPAPRTPSP